MYIRPSVRPSIAVSVCIHGNLAEPKGRKEKKKKKRKKREKKAFVKEYKITHICYNPASPRDIKTPFPLITYLSPISQSPNHDIEAAASHIRQLPQHDSRAGTREVVEIAFHDGLFQEVARRLETHLEEGRCACLEALTIEWRVPASAGHDVRDEVEMANVNGDTVTTSSVSTAVLQSRERGQDSHPPKTAFISLTMLFLAASTP